MPDISFQSTPGYYGIKEIAERNLANSEIPFQRYAGRRIAPFNPLQQQGFQNVGQEVANPVYGQNYEQAATSVRNAAGQNILPQLQPYLTQGTANPTLNAKQYMNPYQEQVINQIGQLASRNLQENILPGVRDKFIGAGQYGSTGHQNFTNRAIRDTQEAALKAQTGALQEGYNKALETAVGQQARQLEAGKIYGATAEDEARRGILGGEALQKITAERQNQGLRGAGALAQFGGIQQQQAQQEANQQYQDWREEQAYPHLQVERAAQIAKGLPVTNLQQYAFQNPQQAPGISPWTQGAGLLAGLYGAAQQGQGGGGGGGGGVFGFATGGHVKTPLYPPQPMQGHPHQYNPVIPRDMSKSHPPQPIQGHPHQFNPVHEIPSIKHLRHYAEGGEVKSPIKRGVNDAMDTAEIHHMRNTALRMNQPQVDPFWASIARAGFNVAASKAPNTLAAIGEGANAGLDEYSRQLGAQDERSLGSSRIMSLIQNTRDAQLKQQQDYEIDQAQLEEQKRQHNMTHGLAASKEAREAEEHRWKREQKNILGSPDKGYFKMNHETGELEKLPMVGQEEKQNTLTFGEHSYTVAPLDSVEKNARAEYQKKVFKDIDLIPKNNQSIKAIETMREVFDRNPNIGTSFINMLDNPEGKDSWFNIFGRKLAGNDLADMEILRKASNDLNLDTILGVSAKTATDMLKKTIASAAPNGKLTKAGFDHVAKKWEEKALENNQIAEAKYDALQKGLSLKPTAYKGKGSQKESQNIPENVSTTQDEWSSLGKPAQ